MSLGRESCIKSNGRDSNFGSPSCDQRLICRKIGRQIGTAVEPGGEEGKLVKAHFSVAINLVYG